MASSILFFPNEILTDIFTSDCLSNGDLFRAQLVCKLFRDNIQALRSRHRRYTFRVDAIGHPTWRLIRYLLENPTLGESFDKINVKWERRDASDSKTWISDWKWKLPGPYSPNERKAIILLCQKWDIDRDTQSNILSGKNSEALLPFLLLFTPNLKSLDIGKFETTLVKYTGRELRDGLALGAIGGDTNDGHPEDKFHFQSEEYRPRHQLFFFGSISISKLLPGLVNLEHLRIGSPDEDAHAFDVSKIIPLFTLPCIRSLELLGLSIDYYSPDDVDKLLNRGRGISPLKRLILESYKGKGNINREYTFRNFKRFCEPVARITGSLESVLIKFKMPEVYRDTSGDDEDLARTFLRYNKKTLRPTKIIINGGGFDEKGKYDENAERRRNVAAKQKLWEQARARLDSSNIKPSPLAKLPPGLISYILSLFDRTDVFNLMLTCKNKVCHRQLWSRFKLDSSSDSPSAAQNSYTLSYKQAAHLRFIIEATGSTGFRHLESLDISSTLFTDSRDANRLWVLKFIVRAIENGETPDLKRLYLDLTSYGPNGLSPATYEGVMARDRATSCGDDPTDDCHATLTALKSYSERKSPFEEFQLHLRIALDGSAVLEFCDMTRLTELRLYSHWSGGPEAAIEELTLLVSVLSALPSQLKSLSLGGGSYSKSVALEGLGTLWENLQELQEVIWNMKCLGSLRITGGYLFHPSFLLLPPENTKRLTYKGKMSASWWRKFANYPFAGVEHLTLKCESLRFHEMMSLKNLGEETCKISADLSLGKIEISGLRWIDIKNRSQLGSSYPTDFLELILKRNSNISNHSLQAIAQERSSRCGGEVRSKLPILVQEQSKKLLQHLEKVFTDQAYEFSMDCLTNQKSLPNHPDFERAMERTVVERLLKQFEDEYAAKFAKECSQALRKSLVKQEGGALEDDA
ncbi:hypothetical protein TWF281_005770 [Arthrobotrys megalospora]